MNERTPHSWSPGPQHHLVAKKMANNKLCPGPRQTVSSVPYHKQQEQEGGVEGLAGLLALEKHWCTVKRGLEKAGGASLWIQSLCSPSIRQEEERPGPGSRKAVTDPRPASDTPGTAILLPGPGPHWGHPWPRPCFATAIAGGQGMYPGWPCQDQSQYHSQTPAQLS